jgi:hypothetical protein
MRVTSELWVSALTRRVFSSGGFATVARRGASEAGAIFIVLRDRLGQLALYAPASQTSYAEARPEERRFSLVVETEDDREIARRLEKECRFDPDMWIVEIEPAGETVEAYFPVTTP